jgi:oligopeptide transport system substrate-binding protein
MRKVKWIFFAYMALVALIIAGIGMSFVVLPDRDPYTLFSTYGSNIRSLDPAKISDVPASQIGGYVFECLYNYDYYKRPYTLVPELAEALPQITDDGKTFTIKIKRGIHYFDPSGGILTWEPVKDASGKMIGRRGPEVKAQDFIYSWKRICDFNLDSQNYSAIFQGKVVGVDDWWKYTKDTPKEKIDWNKPVEGMQAIGDDTIVIKLIDPFPQLSYNLAHLPTATVSREAVEAYGDNFKYTPVGTGPYMLAEYRPDERIVFEANPIYRGGSQLQAENNVSPTERLPHVKRVRLDYFEEDLPAWALFTQALVDVSGIPKDTFSMAIDNRTSDLTPAMRDKGIKLNKSIDPTCFFFVFNMTDPIVGKNKPLRQAMSMAFSRKEYIDLMMNGRGIPMKGPIPPEFPTYDEHDVNPYCEFNLEAARAKVKEAERINGGPLPEITFLLGGTDTTFRQQAELLKAQMAEVGIRIKPDYRTWARFLEVVDSKQAQFFGLGWQADYPDEQTFLQLFYSKNASPGPNSSNYSNPKYDAIYEKAIRMPASPERLKLYKELIAMVQEDCPVIFNCAVVRYSLYYDWVGNVVPTEYAHGVTAYRTLDVEKRLQYQRKH